jgi:hypothetical protein
MPLPGGTPASSDALPAELERRLALLESGSECGDDFDAGSLWWLLILGLLIPAGLLLIGWLA